jgi:hypothetical protein
VRGVEWPVQDNELVEKRTDDEGPLPVRCADGLSKSPSNTPSSTATAGESLLRACASSRLSMSAYSSASSSSKPRLSRVDRCSFSRPYARLT